MALFSEDWPWSELDYERILRAFNEKWQREAKRWNDLGREPVSLSYLYNRYMPVERPYSLGSAGRSLQWLRERSSYSDLSAK